MVAKQVSPDQSSNTLLLGSLVPQDNFYRRLKQGLDLTFLYAAVAPYYGPCGQQSIDPVVFFKLLLVGHLENLCSDQAIDSAFVQASASMATLKAIDLAEWSVEKNLIPLPEQPSGQPTQLQTTVNANKLRRNNR